MFHKINILFLGLGIILFLVSAQSGPCIPSIDGDGDGIDNAKDNCRNDYNPDQLDQDEDRVGDTCDNCLNVPNTLQEDSDGDKVGNQCDNCPRIANPDQQNDDVDRKDSDNDKIFDVCDNCPEVANQSQKDSDGDVIGDICDNCLDTPNTEQLDNDKDGIGDACDPDDDNDGITDDKDNCPYTYNAEQSDWNNNKIGDACEDSDHDFIFDASDNCVLVPNHDQIKSATSWLGKACAPGYFTVKTPLLLDSMGQEINSLEDLEISEVFPFYLEPQDPADDPYADLFICSEMGLMVFENQGIAADKNWWNEDKTATITLKDVTAEVMENVPNYETYRCNFADFFDKNGNGWSDYAVIADEEQNRLFHLDGRFFEEISENIPVASSQRANFVNLNNDSYKDIVMLHENSLSIYINNDKMKYTDQTATRFYPRYSGQIFDVAFADVDQDGDQDMALATADGLKMYINYESGYFADWTAYYFMDDALEKVTCSENCDIKAVMFYDFSNDKIPDLIITKIIRINNNGNNPPATGEEYFEIIPLSLNNGSYVDSSESIATESIKKFSDGCQNGCDTPCDLMDIVNPTRQDIYEIYQKNENNTLIIDAMSLESNLSADTEPTIMTHANFFNSFASQQNASRPVSLEQRNFSKINNDSHMENDFVVGIKEMAGDLFRIDIYISNWNPLFTENSSDDRDKDKDGIIDKFDPQLNNPENNPIPTTICIGPDTDVDGINDPCDNCPLIESPNQEDNDADRIGNLCDNCRDMANPDQKDSDGDEIGDACETGSDIDGDGVLNDAPDNCKYVWNPDQADFDDDEIGDVCDLFPKNALNIGFTEFMYNPKSVTDACGEYTEIFNSGTEAQTIGNWTIIDNQGPVYKFPANQLIQPGEYLILLIGGSNCPNGNGGIISVDDVVYYNLTNFEDGGDTLTLRDDNNGIPENLVDSISYNSSWLNPGAGFAFERKLCRGDKCEESCGNWQKATKPYGYGDYGTPGKENSYSNTNVCP